MISYSARQADATKILTRREMAIVLSELHRKAPRSPNTRMNLMIFRLAACCGLRVSEIAQLRVADLCTKVSRPHVRIRAGASKGGRSRTVPLWWDGGTLADLSAWREELVSKKARGSDALIGCLRDGRQGTPLSRHTLRKRFRTACRPLGEERLATLTIHHGRHTFISHSLAGGRTLAEVRDAAGHSNVSITSGYLHVAVDDEEVGDLFDCGKRT